MRISKFSVAMTAAFLLVAAMLSLDALTVAHAQGPCSVNIPLCGQRNPYTAGAGITIDGNNVISAPNAAAGTYLPLAGGTMSGNIAMGGGNVSGGGTYTAAHLVGSTDVTIGAGAAITSSGAGGALGPSAFNSATGITETCSVTPTGLTIVGGIITAIAGGTCVP